MSPKATALREEQARSILEAQERLARDRAAAAMPALLPPALAEEIRKAAEQERARLLARIDEIDRGLATLAEQLCEARQAERAATIVIEQPASRRVQLDGTIREIKARPVHFRGPAAIEAGKRVHYLVNWCERLKAEKQSRLNELADIVKVEQLLDEGAALTVIAELVRKWQTLASSPIVFAITPPQPTDAAGNALSEGLTALPHGPGYPGEISSAPPAETEEPQREAKSKRRRQRGEPEPEPKPLPPARAAWTEADDKLRAALADLV